jgi:hypothetical protein
VLAQLGADKITVPVDRPIQVAPSTPDLQMVFGNVPGAAPVAISASTALPKFTRQRRCELGLPVPNRLVAKHDAAEEKHLGQIP